MSATRAQVVTEARSWLGTPFHHQGRLKGIGADCAGMVIGVGRALELLDWDVVPQYSRRPNGIEARQFCDTLFDHCPRDDMRAGNILLMGFFAEAQHLAIATGEGTVVHVLALARKCVEHRLDAQWDGFIRAVYQFRGLTDG